MSHDTTCSISKCYLICVYVIGEEMEIEHYNGSQMFLLQYQNNVLSQNKNVHFYEN